MNIDMNIDMNELDPKTLKKAAEILVECGYADYKTDSSNYICWRDPAIDDTIEAVQYFSDNLEGRRQADAIEFHFEFNAPTSNLDLWLESKVITQGMNTPHQWRLDRIKWCLEELSK